MSSNKIQQSQVSLKERIAALEQRNNAGANNKLSTTASTSTNQTLGPKSNRVQGRIASFEEKGAVPVPRGSFGLGAPPSADNSVRKRGELYGNRIPAPAKSRATSGSSTNHRTPSSTSPSPGIVSRRLSLYGADFDDMALSSRPGSALDSPQELQALSPMHTGSGSLSDYSRETIPRGTDFAKALEKARRAEKRAERRSSLYSRPDSLSPEPLMSRPAMTSPASGDTTLVLPDSEVAEALPTSEHTPEVDVSEADYKVSTDSIESSDQSEDKSLSTESGLASPPPEPSTSDTQATTEQVEKSHSKEDATPSPKLLECEVSTSLQSSTDLGCDTGSHEESLLSPSPREDRTMLDNSVSQEDVQVPHNPSHQVLVSVEDHDFVEVQKYEFTHKRMSASSTETAMNVRPMLSSPLSPNDNSGDALTDDALIPESGSDISSPESSYNMPSFAQNSANRSSQSLRSSMRPVSMIENTSPRRVPAHNTQVNASALDASLDEPSILEETEFGTVTTHKPSRSLSEAGLESLSDGVSSNKGTSFSVVVHRKITEVPSSSGTFIPPATPQIARVRKAVNVEPPPSPGYGDLAALLQSAAILEEKLSEGEIPTDVNKSPPIEPPTMSQHTRLPLHSERSEMIQAQSSEHNSGPRRKQSTFRNPLTRKKSNRQPPSTIIHPPPRDSSLPSVVQDLPEAGSRPTTPRQDDDVPPTPPPKSSPSKYLSSIRRLASTSRIPSGHGAYPRHSVSTSSEISSEDSMTVITPPDRSPDINKDGSHIGNKPGSGVVWPSLSPKKSTASIGRAASFAEKMWHRTRSKSNNSLASSSDVTDRIAASSLMEPLPEIGHHHALEVPLISELPAVDVVPPSPQQQPNALPSHVPEASQNSNTSAPVLPPLQRPPSWISVSSTGSSMASPLLDKELFDQFPPVPEDTPAHIPSSSRSGPVSGYGSATTLPRLSSENRRRIPAMQ